MIVPAVDREDASQVRLVEHDHVVEAFATDWADHAFRVRILPRSRAVTIRMSALAPHPLNSGALAKRTRRSSIPNVVAGTTDNCEPLVANRSSLEKWLSPGRLPNRYCAHAALLSEFREPWWRSRGGQLFEDWSRNSSHRSITTGSAQRAWWWHARAGGSASSLIQPT